MRKPSESARERQLQEQIERRLNVLTDNNFQKVIDKLPSYEAHLLTNIREQVKEHERHVEHERELNRTIERNL
ncbi:MAG: hypothetical protein LBC12_08110 [Nitrososphaerota archaeon]|nr:hypothetical protein [Nitrososphaerota archaeon]